jgi:hypothetical protein
MRFPIGGTCLKIKGLRAAKSLQNKPTGGLETPTADYKSCEIWASAWLPAETRMRDTTSAPVVAPQLAKTAHLERAVGW